MKKFIAIIFAAGLIFGFSSCKKDWTCECTFTDTTTNTSSTITYQINDATKGDATDACTAYNITTTTGSYACDLK